MADVQSIIGSANVPDNIKADAWDAFHAATSAADFKTRFDAIGLPNETKAALWDMKYPAGGAGTAPPQKAPAYNPLLRGAKAKGKPQMPQTLPGAIVGGIGELGGTIAGDIYSTLANLPAGVMAFLRHPYETSSRALEAFQNIPEGIARSFETKPNYGFKEIPAQIMSAHPGEGLARLLEFGGPAVAETVDAVMPAIRAGASMAAEQTMNAARAAQTPLAVTGNALFEGTKAALSPKTVLAAAPLEWMTTHMGAPTGTGAAIAATPRVVGAAIKGGKATLAKRAAAAEAEATAAAARPAAVATPPPPAPVNKAVFEPMPSPAFPGFPSPILPPESAALQGRLEALARGGGPPAAAAAAAPPAAPPPPPPAAAAPAATIEGNAVQGPRSAVPGGVGEQLPPSTQGTPGGSQAAQAAQYRPQANTELQQVVNDYNAQRGLPPVDHSQYHPLDQDFGRRVADAYDALKADNSADPRVRAAYEALIEETKAQYEHLVANGYNLEPWTKPGQPYASSHEMVADLKNNKHLYFFTGGEAHPFLSAIDPATGLTMNDIFRAVHDAWAHATGGFGFGPRGEEMAHDMHSQSYSPLARLAMTTETRGQNSWVNFGKHNYDAQGNPLNLSATQKPYAEQKVDILPAEFQTRAGERQLPPPPAAAAAAPATVTTVPAPDTAAIQQTMEQAARNTKTDVLSRTLFVHGISPEDAANITPEQWAAISKSTGVNPPSPTSIDQTITKLRDLHTAAAQAAEPPPAPPAVAANPEALGIAERLRNEMQSSGTIPNPLQAAVEKNKAAAAESKAALTGEIPAPAKGIGSLQEQLQTVGDEALDRLKKSGAMTGTTMSSLFPAEVTRDMITWGAARIANGAIDFGKFSKSMLADAKTIGPQAVLKVSKMLPELWTAASKEYQHHAETIGPSLADLPTIMKYYRAGKEGKDWYTFVRPALQPIFGDNTDLFLKMFAATSPNTNVTQNVGNAIKAYRQFLSGEPFNGFMKAHLDNLNRAVAGVQMSGPKVGAFGPNLLGDLTPVTVDLWMARALLGREKVTDLQSKLVDYMTSQAAMKVGLKPAEMQAAVWTGIKKLSQSRDTAAPPEVIVNEYLARNPVVRQLFSDALKQGEQHFAQLKTRQAPALPPRISGGRMTAPI